MLPFPASREAVNHWITNGSSKTSHLRATNASLTFHQVPVTRAGTYTLRVQNTLGAVISNPAVLTVESWNTGLGLRRTYKSDRAGYNEPRGRARWKGPCSWKTGLRGRTLGPASYRDPA